ncbi:metalloendopeptidase [Coemansia sp. RSA 552]|nr:metalloendopeptidase [Coemansia sp. RSA 552]
MDQYAAAPAAAVKDVPVHFDLGPKEIARIVEEAIAKSTSILDTVAAQSAPTFGNAIVPLATSHNEFTTVTRVVTFLQNASPDKDVRNASANADKAIDAFTTHSNLREDVQRAVMAVLNNKQEMAKLDAEDRLLVETLAQRRGGDKSPQSNDATGRLEAIKQRLTELEIEFVSNIRSDTSSVSLTRKELEGMCDGFFDGRRTELVNGVDRFVVSTKMSDVTAVLRNAVHEETRKRVFLAQSSRCPDNIALLQEAVGLRLEQARLLGYASHAELQLEKRMAKTPGAVMELEESLRDKLRTVADKELEELRQLKQQELAAAGKPAADFYEWDYSRYANQAMVARHSIDHDEVMQYFTLEATVRGLLDLFQTTLGLKIASADNQGMWHPEVQAFRVTDASSEQLLGYFYLDLIERPEKYRDVAVWPVRPGYEHADGTREAPASVVLASFPPPTPAAPTLLSHKNVRNLTHALGHVVQNLCSVTRWSHFHGMKVARDFMEVPSQVFLSWVWEPSVLRGFAVHYKTGEPIPEDLVRRLVAAKNEGSGIKTLRQVFRGLFDMAIHSAAAADVDVKAEYNALSAQVALANYGDADVGRVATFSHMMEGYDAGYYGHLWSEVYAADIFSSRFLKDAGAGADFRRQLLQPGGTRDPLVGLEAFLGRKPNDSAYFQSIGLI